jgi:uncharacterized membrane protein
MNKLFVTITFYNALFFSSLLVCIIAIVMFDLRAFDTPNPFIIPNPLIIISAAIVFLTAPINFVAYKGLKEGDREPYLYEAINANIHGVLFILISIFLLVLPIVWGMTMSQF